MASAQLWQLANLRLSQGNARGASEVLQQILGTDPDDPDAHALLAVALLGEKRLVAADAEARIALALESECRMGLYALAHVAIAQRKFVEAREHLELLLTVEPEDPANHRAMALLERRLDRLDAAREALNRALELDPIDPETLSGLGTLALARGDFGEAERLATEALQADPGHVDSLVLMGSLLLRDGRVGEAREHAVEALRTDPSDADVMRLFAQIKARESWLLGSWWRFMVWITSYGSRRVIVILLGMFVAYRFAQQGLIDLGYEDVARYVQYAWLGLAMYTWVAPAWFKQTLMKEINEVKLRDDF